MPSTSLLPAPSYPSPARQDDADGRIASDMSTIDFSLPDHPSAELAGAHPASSDAGAGKAHQCHICDKTYERRDHLSRHIKSHQEQRNHICPECGKGFHRGDLLTRHRAVHLKDPSVEGQRRRTSKACQSCISAKTKCNEERPCARCQARNEPCQPTQARVRILDKSNSNKGAVASATDMTSNQARGVAERTQTTPRDEHDSGLLAFQNAAAYDGDANTFHQFAFPDFFDQIMNMPTVASDGMHEPLMAPPNVSTFGDDDFGFSWTSMDYDFSQLAGGLTRPSTAQGMRPEVSGSTSTQNSPQSEAQLRSEAIDKSPWGWNRWIPDKTHTTFSGQEINVTEQRVNADDQLTPGDGSQFYVSLDLQARDRILRLVTSIAASRLTIASFPSPELLNDLLNIFVLQEREAVDSYVHWPSIDCREMRGETLLGILAKGAVYVALRPVWKIGLVFQEIVRLAIADVFETDNSTTRQLQPLQAYLLNLDVGLWSGFRRKAEIATSFLQPAATMLSWSDALTKFRYRDVQPSHNDDAVANQAKWKEWIEQESLKRLVLHTFIHDSQTSLAHTKDPLLSPSRMQLPLPASLDLWRAQDAEAWRSSYLSTPRLRERELPSVVAIGADINMLQKYGRSVDQRLCTLLACHLISYDVLQYRQQATVFASNLGYSRRDRWLAHTNRQKDIYEDLVAMHTYCDVFREPMPEATFLLHYLMMLLHTAFDDIQLFSGRSGESEARRVYPLIKAWTEDAESRTAIWHAGQALRAARFFEQTKLRDFYSVILHHVALTLWVYGMVTSNKARMSKAHTPTPNGSALSSRQARDGSGGDKEDVLLDGEDSRQAKAFRHWGQGRPCLTKLTSAYDPFGSSNNYASAVAETCPLEQPKGVMLLASQIMQGNFPNSCSGLPPLVDNLVKLMNELSRFSGKDAG